MPTFDAHLELRTDAEQLEHVTKRLREVATAARGVGFELVNAEVTLVTDPEDDSGEWSAYRRPTG